MTDNDHHEKINDHSVRIALLELGMKNITTELANINTSISWLVKLVGAAIILGIVQFILRGGLVL